MAKTHRHDAGFNSVARRRRRGLRNRNRGDYAQRGARSRSAKDEAIAEAYADYSTAEEVLNLITRGEL